MLAAMPIVSEMIFMMEISGNVLSTVKNSELFICYTPWTAINVHIKHQSGFSWIYLLFKQVSSQRLPSKWKKFASTKATFTNAKQSQEQKRRTNKLLHFYLFKIIDEICSSATTHTYSSHTQLISRWIPNTHKKKHFKTVNSEHWTMKTRTQYEITFTFIILCRTQTFSVKSVHFIY